MFALWYHWDNPIPPPLAEAWNNWRAPPLQSYFSVLYWEKLISFIVKERCLKEFPLLSQHIYWRINLDLRANKLIIARRLLSQKITLCLISCKGQLTCTNIVPNLDIMRTPENYLLSKHLPRGCLKVNTQSEGRSKLIVRSGLRTYFSWNIPRQIPKITIVLNNNMAFLTNSTITITEIQSFPIPLILTPILTLKLSKIIFSSLPTMAQDFNNLILLLTIESLT